MPRIPGSSTPPAAPDHPAGTSDADLPEHAEVVRRFNRSYTQRIGALEESFLGLGMPLGTARLLYEIGVEPGTTRDLRARLNLDSGYLSRLLRRLEADALVAVEPDPADRRRRRVELTSTGRRTWEELERRSADRARDLVSSLTGGQRARLAAALAEADLLVRAATVRLERVDPVAPVALAAVEAYAAELDERFPGGFEIGDLAEGAERLRPPDGAFVVATSDGIPVACGGVQALGGGIGEIKRMWVRPGWRLAGLGSRLLRHLEDVGRDLGHSVMRLDTHGSLTEAVLMYRRAGYREIERYNDNPYAERFFTKTLH